MTTAEDFFTGGSTSAKFPTVGTTVAGRITRVGEPMQQRDFSTGEPKTWDDGKPMLQLPVDLATDEREDADDDGVRTLYVKGAMQKAIRDALRKAGARGLAVGGHLAVTYSGDGVAKARGLNAPKEYQAVYTAPDAAADFLAADEPEPVAAPAAPAVDVSKIDPAVLAAALAAVQGEKA